MYKSSGVVVFDSFPLRRIDGDVLDSVISSMEEGILYVLIVNGKDSYKSPFSFEQVENWVYYILDSPKVVVVDVPITKDPSDKSGIVLEVSNILSKLERLPHQEPLDELYCFDNTLKETNPYVLGIKEVFKERVVIGVEGVDVEFSRKEVFDRVMSGIDLEEFRPILTTKSYQSFDNYLKKA